MVALSVDKGRWWCAVDATTMLLQLSRCHLSMKSREKENHRHSPADGELVCGRKMEKANEAHLYFWASHLDGEA